MRSFPIWNQITACIYGSKKSYGVKDTGENEIFVGSSAKNSTSFLTSIITKREIEDTKYGNCIVFSYSVDDIIIKKMYFIINKKGNADEFIKTETKLNRIKSL